MATAARTVRHLSGAFDSWTSEDAESDLALPTPTETLEGSFEPARNVLPQQLIALYARLASLRAVTEHMEDGRWFASVPGLRGAWAEGASEAEASVALEVAIRDWVQVKMQRRHDGIPVIGGIDLNPHG